MKRNILVTGGAGFIGCALVARLCEDPTNFVVVVDNLLTGHRDNLPNPAKKNLVFIKEDINNIKEVSDIFARYSFEYVFHYAAIVGVQRTLSNPILVLEDIDGLRNIMSLAKNTISDLEFVKSMTFLASSRIDISISLPMFTTSFTYLSS